MYRCNNLTINYLTPRLLIAWIACGRTFVSYQSFSLDGAAKASGGCPLTHSYYIKVISGLDRVLLGPYWWDAWLEAWKAFINDKSFRSYQRFPTPSEMFVSAEPAMSRCPVGKVPSSHKESSSNHSLLDKACLFSAKGLRTRVAHSLKEWWGRQVPEES